jgi:hypothetical protein
MWKKDAAKHLEDAPLQIDKIAATGNEGESRLN